MMERYNPRPPHAQGSAVVQGVEKSCFRWHADVGHQIMLSLNEVWVEENLVRPDVVLLEEGTELVAHCCGTECVEPFDAQNAPCRPKTPSGFRVRV
jgi:hypothetical protein